MSKKTEDSSVLILAVVVQRTAVHLVPFINKVLLFSLLAYALQAEC